jgi:hypothetical protein
MIATSPSNSFRTPSKAPDNFNILAREATELFKALLRPGKFVEEVKFARAQQVKAQSGKL